MNLEEFECKTRAPLPESGSVAWQAPSNIALVKYWGKTGLQLPANPSVSFTLDACRTQTELRYSRLAKPAGVPPARVFFEGRPAPDFEPKIQKFLSHAVAFQPFLKDVQLEIHTTNSFPHSSGIASSASGMAALALCLMDLERSLIPEMQPEYFRRKASFLARLGSGSASRSIDGGLVLWGSHPGLPGSSDLYAIPYPREVHPSFLDFHDTILLVDKGRKPVSSSAGHGLMHGHPFADARFTQARGHLDQLQGILREGDLKAFADLVETEALSLHAMMQTSHPSYVLMKPETLAILERIREYRASSGQPVCFTLDAGANVHVLYPESAAFQVYAFIRGELLDFCQQGQHICDRTGPGASRIG